MADKPKARTEQEAERGPGEAHPVAVSVAKCHQCGASIGEGDSRCPECGRRLYRICYCGWRIPVTAERCPRCDADWSNSRRVRKRAHSHKVQPARLGAYAAGGALVALLAAILGDVVMNGLAARALPVGRDMPVEFGARVVLAWLGAGQLAGEVGHRLGQISGALTVVLVVILLGAALGAVIYLFREDLLRLPRSVWTRKQGKHRRRRVR